jgi:hypothetical protein
MAYQESKNPARTTCNSRSNVIMEKLLMVQNRNEKLICGTHESCQQHSELVYVSSLRSFGDCSTLLYSYSHTFLV